MSNLPPAVLPRETVDIGGTYFDIRSLTRDQAYKLKDITDEGEQEASVIAWGTGSTLAEAQEYRATTGFAQVTPLVDAILQLSGLKAIEGKDEDAPKD